MTTFYTHRTLNLDTVLTIYTPSHVLHTTIILYKRGHNKYCCFSVYFLKDKTCNTSRPQIQPGAKTLVIRSFSLLLSLY